MFTHSIMITLSLCFAGPVTQPDPQDPPGNRAGPREREDRNDADRDARRERRRARRERYRNAAPEKRREMRLDRYVRMTTRAYELDEAQQIVVRGEIEAMDAERRVKMGPDAEEYDRLRDKMFEFWGRQAGNEGEGRRRGRDGWRGMRDNPEFQKLRRKMRDIEEKHPFDMEAAIQRVEKLLPEEQVKKGRERRAGWQERRARWRGRRRNREEPPSTEAKAGDTQVPTPEQRAAVEKAVKAADEVRTKAQLAEDVKRVTKLVEKQAAKELHPWEKHVRDFISRYKLTDPQVAAAMSILKDVRKRAVQIEQTNAKKVDEANKIKDKAGQKARLKALNEPIDRLFDELKKRLDGLLTASQRAAVKK